MSGKKTDGKDSWLLEDFMLLGLDLGIIGMTFVSLPCVAPMLKYVTRSPTGSYTTLELAAMSTSSVC